MGLIPKIFIKEGVQATQAAKEAVANVERTIKREVINTDKLVRNPASDLFEKKAYMETEEFWHQPQNMANYAKGLYLTEGVEAASKNMKKMNEKIIVEQTDKMERGFELYSSCPEMVTYYERDLVTGAGREVKLLNGKPYRHAEWKPDGAGVLRSETYLNQYTGEEICSWDHYHPEGRLKSTNYKYGKDSKKVLSRTQEFSDGVKFIDILSDDGKSVLLTKKLDKDGNLISIDSKKMRINVYEGTKIPEIVSMDKPNERGIYETYNTVYLDKNGNKQPWSR